jgi:hypothetical protein
MGQSGLDKPCILVRTRADGYAALSKKSKYRDKWVQLHVYALEEKLGRAIAYGKQVNHKCGIGNCIEQEHLYEGTQKENVRDTMNSGKHHTPKPQGASVKTHCLRGHLLVRENSGYRGCRECPKLKSRRK